VAGSTTPASLEGDASGDMDVGVKVPISRFRTEMWGSTNFVLYSERT
jgi:hypothetical protein